MEAKQIDFVTPNVHEIAPHKQGSLLEDILMITQLLAIDLGLRAGFALYEYNDAPDAPSPLSLLWYRSHHFADRSAWKRGAYTLLSPLEEVGVIALEGDRLLGEVWEKLAQKRGASIHWASAERWREEILLRREQRSGQDAKKHALALAQAIIAAYSPHQPTTPLRDDTAEAILLGLWAALQEGWITHLPDEIARGRA